MSKVHKKEHRATVSWCGQSVITKSDKYPFKYTTVLPYAHYWKEVTCKNCLEFVQKKIVTTYVLKDKYKMRQMVGRKL